MGGGSCRFILEDPVELSICIFNGGRDTDFGLSLGRTIQVPPLGLESSSSYARVSLEEDDGGGGLSDLVSFSDRGMQEGMAVPVESSISFIKWANLACSSCFTVNSELRFISVRMYNGASVVGDDGSTANAVVSDGPYLKLWGLTDVRGGEEAWCWMFLAHSERQERSDRSL